MRYVVYILYCWQVGLVPCKFGKVLVNDLKCQISSNVFVLVQVYKWLSTLKLKRGIYQCLECFFLQVKVLVLCLENFGFTVVMQVNFSTFPNFFAFVNDPVIFNVFSAIFLMVRSFPNNFTNTRTSVKLRKRSRIGWIPTCITWLA